MLRASSLELGASTWSRRVLVVEVVVELLKWHLPRPSILGNNRGVLCNQEVGSAIDLGLKGTISVPETMPCR